VYERLAIIAFLSTKEELNNKLRMPNDKESSKLKLGKM
jgi:hypothetical protein